MARRKWCDNCREGIACRACGSPLVPLPALLTARDYTMLLALIDGSDRKYAPKVLDTVSTVLKCDRARAKGALQRLRIKLRRLLKRSQVTTGRASRKKTVEDAATTAEEITRQAKAGEISWEEAEELLAEL